MDSTSQAAIEGCFTSARLDSSTVQFRCRQCTDIADFFVEIGPKFRFPVWESYLNDQSKGGVEAERWPRHCELAVTDFCRAVKEAEAFLQDHCCTSAGKKDWKLCANGLTKLDTGEAYDVHLQNLIWSKAGLEVAILRAGIAWGSVPSRYLQSISGNDVEKVVANCRRALSRFGSSYKEYRLRMDRLDFNDSVQSLIRGGTLGGAENYLAFLWLKSGAALRDKSGASAAHPDLTTAFEISDEDLDPADSEQILGEGTWGRVYVRSLWLGQIKTAVKVIPVHYESDSDTEAAEQGFKAEASLLARLQSPYVVQLMGWAIDRRKKEGKLVMELVTTDLGKVLRDAENREGLHLHVAVDLMLQVAKAMEHLHRHNIIHRDLKPSNILLQPATASSVSSRGGELWRVKICDFGIAKMKPREGDLYSTFRLGTMWYRSPEILSERVKYSIKADVYSFAIACAEMLGGYSATLNLSQGEGSLLSRIESNQRPSLPAECPAALSDLLRKCWHTEADKRPPFSDIASTLRYIKFILMRGPAGANFGTLLTPFDEYELKQCMAGALHMETALGTDASFMWDSQDSAEALQQRARPRRWLQSGESLQPRESVMAWERYRLTMQPDGNLVLLDYKDMLLVWASGRTARQSMSGLPFVCSLRPNGNLVIHSGREELWSSSSIAARASYKLELDFNGRAVISGPNASIIWATERNVLKSGDLLPFNTGLTNNGYLFTMQGDGNLVLYDEQHHALWASGTNSRANKKNCRCTLQDNGLLVVLKGDNTLVWNSEESSSIASYKLELHRDGNVTIASSSGTVIWETFTGAGEQDDDY